MKFSSEQIKYISEALEKSNLEESRCSEILEGLTGKKKEEKPKKEEKQKEETCHATTKLGTKCTKKIKENFLCSLHLKKPKSTVKSEPEVIDDLSIEEKKKHIESLFNDQ
jgi:hypothetical protein